MANEDDLMSSADSDDEDRYWYESDEDDNGVQYPYYY